MSDQKFFRKKQFFSQKITIWGIKTLSVRVGRGGGRWVGVWASPAVGQRQGRLGPARSRLAGTEIGGATGKFRQSAVARCGWGRVSCEKRALGDFERGKGGGRLCWLCWLCYPSIIS